MTREDRVLELFAEANPVPDTHPLVIDPETRARLATIEHRNPDIEGATVRSLESPTEERNRRGWLLGAAAAIVVAVVGVVAGLALLGLNSESQPSTEETSTTTTTVTPAVDATEIRIATQVVGFEDAPFEASGTAVDAGVVCADGHIEYVDSELVEDGNPTDLWRIETKGVCADGTGTLSFEINQSETISPQMVQITGSWEVRSGTDAYAGFVGGGEIEGRCGGPSLDPNECRYVLTGSMEPDGS